MPIQTLKETRYRVSIRDFDDNGFILSNLMWYLCLGLLTSTWLRLIKKNDCTSCCIISNLLFFFFKTAALYYLTDDFFHWIWGKQADETPDGKRSAPMDTLFCYYTTIYVIRSKRKEWVDNHKYKENLYIFCRAIGRWRNHIFRLSNGRLKPQITASR